MKKLTVLIALYLALSLAACSKPAASSDSSSKMGPSSQAASSASSISPVPTKAGMEDSTSSGGGASTVQGTQVEKDFGSYLVPQGWAESEELSQENYYFYLQEGTSLDKPTSNISINQATNKYSKEDSAAFSHAILAQIAEQVGSDVVDVVGGITETKNGTTVITIEVEIEEMLTVQYYIVGDYEFVMVQMSDYYDEAIPDVQEVAKEMVDSFVWAA